MALNSYVTPEGGELGRAQAYQARAAGVEPHVDMNPVLLKPSSQTGSQVIVLGRPVRHMAVREYHAYQPEVWPVVTAAYDRLRAANDLIVIEGAGSPAEINLRGQDIVNMRVALYAQSPDAAHRRHRPRRRVRQPGRPHGAVHARGARARRGVRDQQVPRRRQRCSTPGIEFLQRADGRPDARRRAHAHRLARRRGGLPRHRGPAAPGEAGRAAADRRRPPAVHQQLHGLRRAGRRAGRQRALRDHGRRARGCGGDRAARHQEHDRRPRVAARERDGGGADGAGRRRHARGRRLRRLPDARSPHPRPRAGGVRRRRRRRSRPARRRDHLRRRQAHGARGGRAAALGGQARPGGCSRPRPRPGRDAAARLRDPHGPDDARRRAAPLLRLRGADGSEHEDGAVWPLQPGEAPPPRPSSAAATCTASSTIRSCARAFLNGLRAGLGLPERESAAPSPDDDIDRLADHVEAYLDPALLERIVGLEAR